MTHGFSRSQKSNPIAQIRAAVSLPSRGHLILMLAVLSWIVTIGAFALITRLLALLF